MIKQDLINSLKEYIDHYSLRVDYGGDLIKKEDQPKKIKEAMTLLNTLIG